MILYIARHGQTADNVRRIFQGHAGKGLNSLGRAQAARLGERMKPLGISAIVASDLERAAETANLVSNVCGVPVQLDRGLREVDIGTWSGKSYDEVAALYPDEWSAVEGGLDIRRGGGESYAELAERVDQAIRGIIAQPGADPGGRILIVSHGGAIKSWITKILAGSVAGARSRPTLGSVANAGFSTVETEPNGSWFRLDGWNDTAHLENLVTRSEADDEPAPA